MIDIKIYNCTEPEKVQALFAEDKKETVNVDDKVADIIKSVSKDGDKALYKYSEMFDGVKLDSLMVSAKEIENAVENCDKEFMQVLKEAAENIKAYHQKQKRNGYIIDEKPGIIMGQKIIPLDRVGLYVPGGTASYPSTVLMDAIPAKIAGVKECVMVTPPSKDGSVPADILAAAYVAGVDKIFKIGGAQAVAALAYGTESIPKVDKIMGPGNIYVATAKRMVYGLVDIDMIAGPSDVLIVADKTANPVYVAADMLAQAEHDKLARAVLVTTEKDLADKVIAELKAQLDVLPRKEIATESIINNGAIIITDNVKTAVEISNNIAPEHLELCVEEPFALLGLVRHAGSIFLGHNTPEALGDYFAGPNHTLPTEGTARFSSPLSVDDFCKKSSFLYYQREELQKVAEKVAMFAKREGLDAHARSVEKRFD